VERQRAVMYAWRMRAGRGVVQKRLLKAYERFLEQKLGAAGLLSAYQAHESGGGGRAPFVPMPAPPQQPSMFSPGPFAQRAGGRPAYGGPPPQQQQQYAPPQQLLPQPMGYYPGGGSGGGGGWLAPTPAPFGAPPQQQQQYDGQQQAHPHGAVPASLADQLRLMYTAAAAAVSAAAAPDHGAAMSAGAAAAAAVAAAAGGPPGMAGYGGPGVAAFEPPIPDLSPPQRQFGALSAEAAMALERAVRSEVSAAYYERPAA